MFCKLALWYGVQWCDLQQRGREEVLKYLSFGLTSPTENGHNHVVGLTGASSAVGRF